MQRTLMRDSNCPCAHVPHATATALANFTYMRTGVTACETLGCTG